MVHNFRFLFDYIFNFISSLCNERFSILKSSLIASKSSFPRRNSSFSFNSTSNFWFSCWYVSSCWALRWRHRTCSFINFSFSWNWIFEAKRSWNTTYTISADGLFLLSASSSALSSRRLASNMDSLISHLLVASLYSIVAISPLKAWSPVRTV